MGQEVRGLKSESGAEGADRKKQDRRMTERSRQEKQRDGSIRMMMTPPHPFVICRFKALICFVSKLSRTLPFRVTQCAAALSPIHHQMSEHTHNWIHVQQVASLSTAGVPCFAVHWQESFSLLLSYRSWDH